LAESTASDPFAAAVAAAVAALGRGEVVAYPTETFYGLGVDATDEAALARLAALKGRGAEKAISVLVVGPEMLDRLCVPDPSARSLMAAHWPGPLTLALPARPGLPAPIVADGCVAVRESPHPLARALVAAFGRPVTTTSANHAGAPPATTAAQVRASFGDGCHVLDGGPTPGGAPSTLARVRGGRVEVLRQGAIRLDQA
jgi:L-threonylcarbamoyladenylate synthase